MIYREDIDNMEFYNGRNIYLQDSVSVEYFLRGFKKSYVEKFGTAHDKEIFTKWFRRSNDNEKRSIANCIRGFILYKGLDETFSYIIFDHGTSYETLPLLTNELEISTEIEHFQSLIEKVNSGKSSDIENLIYKLLINNKDGITNKKSVYLN